MDRVTFHQLRDLHSPWFSHESHRAKTALLGLPGAGAVAPAELGDPLSCGTR